MAQLVGQTCVHCRERLGDELYARFCPRCGCPVHDACRRAPGADDPPGACPVCAASAAETARWRPAADEHARTEARTATRGGPAGGIWYATDDWLRRWVKFAWAEDRGVFAAAPGEVRYVGQRVVLRVARVTGAELVGPRLPRVAVVSLGLMNLVILAMMAGGAFTVLTPGNPATYLVLAGVNALALGSCPMRWVRVSYAGEDGRDGVAYFTPASALSRWGGGTEHLLGLFRGRDPGPGQKSS